MSNVLPTKIPISEGSWKDGYAKSAMTAVGHVWTAPWQELSNIAAALVGCGHVSGLFVRHGWPLAMTIADLRDEWKDRDSGKLR